MLWKVIDLLRAVAGVFWFPALTLDMFGRDWAGFTHPLNFEIASTSKTVNTSTWTDLVSIVVVLPKNWLDDATFDEGLNIQISITADYTASGGSITQITDVRIEDGDQQVQYDTSGTITLTKTIAFSSSRETVTIQGLQSSAGAATTSEISKSLSDGPTGAITAVRA